jgi:hypothetical protein
LAIPLEVMAADYCFTVPALDTRWVGCTVSLTSLSVDGLTLTPYPYGGGFYGYTVYLFDGVDNAFTPTRPSIGPGQGMLLRVPTNMLVCFDVPLQSAVLPLNLQPGLNVVSCQSNIVASFEAIVGRAPDEGTHVYKLNPGSGGHAWFDVTKFPPSPAYTAYFFTNGAWSPSVPTAGIGEAVFVYQPRVARIISASMTSVDFQMSISTVINTTVTVQRTDNLNSINWQVVTNFPGDGKIRTISDNEAKDVVQRYYRVEAN